MFGSQVLILPVFGEVGEQLSEKLCDAAVELPVLIPSRVQKVEGDIEQHRQLRAVERT